MTENTNPAGMPEEVWLYRSKIDGFIEEARPHAEQATKYRADRATQPGDELADIDAWLSDVPGETRNEKMTFLFHSRQELMRELDFSTALEIAEAVFDLVIRHEGVDLLSMERHGAAIKVQEIFANRLKQGDTKGEK